MTSVLPISTKTVTCGKMFDPSECSNGSLLHPIVQSHSPPCLSHCKSSNHQKPFCTQASSSPPASCFLSLDTSVKTRVREQRATEMRYFLLSWPRRDILCLLGRLRMISASSESESGMMAHTCKWLKKLRWDNREPGYGLGLCDDPKKGRKIDWAFLNYVALGCFKIELRTQLVQGWGKKEELLYGEKQ